MKTVLHRNQDGHEIITGFGEASIDPVATWAKITDRVLALPEVAQMTDLKGKTSAQMLAGANAWAMADAEYKAYMAQFANPGKSEDELARAQSGYLAYMAQYQSAQSAISSLEAQLPQIMKAFEKGRSSLFEANAEFFGCGPGQDHLSDADYVRLSAQFEALKENEQLAMDGKIIPDWRGSVYWTKAAGKWKAGVVSALGAMIPAGAIAEGKLTEAQSAEINAQTEVERIAGLTADQKAAELASRTQVAAQDAANRKGLAEITGEKFDAAAWYASEKVRLEDVYK